MRILFTQVDQSAGQYEMRRGEYGGVPYYAVVHNHTFDAFEATYVDPRMDEIFNSVIDDAKPDVVHIHHLLFHSINYIAIAKRRNIPVVFTLHDYWLSCPNMGQRLTPQGVVCRSVEPRHCARCIARHSPFTRTAKRAALAVAGRRERARQRATLERFRFEPESGSRRQEGQPEPVTIGGVQRAALVFPGPGRFEADLPGRDATRVGLRIGAGAGHWNGDSVAVVVNGREVESIGLGGNEAVNRSWIDVDVRVRPDDSDRLRVELVWRGCTELTTNLLACADVKVTRRLEPRGATLIALKNRFRSFEGSIGALMPARRRAVTTRLDLIREACGGVDIFIAPSQFMADRMAEFGLDPARVVHSRNGTGLPDSRHQVRPPSDRVRFAFVGVLSPRKGVHLLVDAFRRVRAAGAPLQAALSIHGNPAAFPEYSADLRRRAEGLGICFAGEFDHEAAAAIYSHVDVVVLPSIWWENAPMTAFEAWAGGAVVVAADTGGLSEIVEHGVNGLLVAPNDVEALADAMTRLVTEPELLERLRSAAVPVKSASQDAADMEQRYASLFAAHGTA